MDSIKKYWWAFLLGIVAIVYFLFFNKKGKKVRRRSTRRVKRYSSRMRSRYSSYRQKRRTRRLSRRRR